MTTAATVILWLAYGAFVAGGAALAVIDARTKLLPNRIVLPLYGIGLAAFGAASWLDRDGRQLLPALAALVLAYVTFYAMAMFGPMGYGDVKLAGVVGLYLGRLGIPTAFAGLMLGLLAATLVGLARLVPRRARARGTEIALGPYLIGGSWAALVLAECSVLRR